MHEAQNELDKLRSDLETVKIERDEARSELSANEDVSVERRAVRHQVCSLTQFYAGCLCLL